MSPKNKFPIDIDNRESKKSVVQRFMTSEDEVKNESDKKVEPVEQQQELPHYEFHTPKNIDEIEDNETEEASLEKARKPSEENPAAGSNL